MGLEVQGKNIAYNPVVIDHIRDSGLNASGLSLGRMPLVFIYR